MSSELKTNKISPATSTTVTLGDASDLFQLPASAEIDIASGATLDVNGTIDVTGATLTGFPGLFASYAIFVDQKSSNTDGGTFTSGAWRQRDLNTTLANTDTTNITLGTNEFTLLTGTYLIEWFPTVGGAPDRTQSALHDGTSIVGLSNSAYVNYSPSPGGGSARITVSGTKTFTIQHRCESTISGHGFGEGSSFDTEQYTMVKIFKES